MMKGAEKFRKELRETKDQELTELAELLEMQQKLDESILKEKGITEYPVDEIETALIVELGELMNEFPTKFKYWKSTAVDNRKKGLEEYVDCLHFALSIANYLFGLTEGKKIYHYLVYLFELGYILGFTWNEIYKAYKDKNKVNYERLQNGY